jgi:transcriptional regulator with XRE-family HTH domain
VDKKPHPFPGKVTFEEADEIRRLRRGGKALADLAGRFNIAKSSVSAICHFRVHTPAGLLRVALPEFELALLAEIAEDEEVPIEQFASDLLLDALRSRAW